MKTRMRLRELEDNFFVFRNIKLPFTNTLDSNWHIFAVFMNSSIFSKIFSFYLAALILLSTSVQLLHEISKFQKESALVNEPVAEQLTVNTIRPLFAEINFSGLQQIIIHPVKSLEKNNTSFLRHIEGQLFIKWKQASLLSLVMELSLSVSKIIFPSHFFW